MIRNVLHDPVLVLNKGWSPIDTCTVRKAFSRLFDDRCKFLQTEDDLYALHGVMSWLELPVYPEMNAVTTARFQIRAPEIIVLSESDHITKRRKMAFSRRNLGRRDHMTCQYCGCGPKDREMTIDHVHPKAKGGLSTWVNCVLSCLSCNGSKKDKTPEVAGMQLIVRPELKDKYPRDPSKWRKPYAPSWSPVFRVAPNRIKSSWKKFIK